MIYTSEDDLQKVEACQSYSDLIVKTLCFNVVHLWIFSWILTISTRIWIAYIVFRFFTSWLTYLVFAHCTTYSPPLTLSLSFSFCLSFCLSVSLSLSLSHTHTHSKLYQCWRWKSVSFPSRKHFNRHKAALHCRGLPETFMFVQYLTWNYKCP
jgi:hypothetical protein